MTKYMISSILSFVLNIFEQTNLLMNKTVFKIFILVFGISASSYSQDFEALWQSHYSYNNIVDVVNGENKIYAAAENAVFEYDVCHKDLFPYLLWNGFNLVFENFDRIHRLISRAVKPSAFSG